jgi:Zinc finger, C2H2 type.
VLQNGASEVTLHSQAVVPNLEHLGYGIEHMTPKSHFPQEEKIKKFRNMYLNPVTDTQDLNRIELPQCTRADGSVTHTNVEHFQKQLGDWYPCKYCGKCYSDQKKLATHQREDCGNGPGFECPYCCVIIRRKGNLLRHIRKFHA